MATAVTLPRPGMRRRPPEGMRLMKASARPSRSPGTRSDASDTKARHFGAKIVGCVADPWSKPLKLAPQESPLAGPPRPLELSFVAPTRHGLPRFDEPRARLVTKRLRCVPDPWTRLVADEENAM